MDYNIQGLKDKIVAELLLIQTANQPKVKAAVDAYIYNAEGRYQALLEYMADKGDVKFLIERLGEEKDILKQEVLSLFSIAKGAAQAALNNVQDILLQEVKTVIEDAEKAMKTNHN